MTGRWQMETWLEPDEIEGQEYADYWNDESVEQSKEWNVLDGGFARMEAYLADVGLPDDLRAAVAAAGGRLGPTGADLASGTLWSLPILVELGARRVYCVEYSRHRLLKLGPAVLDHYGIPEEVPVLALGSFYDIKLDDRALDFVLLLAGVPPRRPPGRAARRDPPRPAAGRRGDPDRRARRRAARLRGARRAGSLRGCCHRASRHPAAGRSPPPTRPRATTTTAGASTRRCSQATASTTSACGGAAPSSRRSY